jgi:hypothetical protein
MTTTSLALKAGTIAAEWVILLSAIRYFNFGMRGVAPLAIGLFRLCTCSAVKRAACKQAFSRRVDAFSVAFLDTVMWPASSVLIFAGIALVGLGLALGSLGDVAVMASRYPDRWIGLERTLGWTQAPILALGMGCGLAALSRRRTISCIITGLWALVGIGIGMVAAIAWPSLPVMVMVPIG